MDEPKLPLSTFCNAMKIWAAACITPLPDDDEQVRRWRKQFERHWRFLELAIRKSNLLYRLLYAAEELRKTPCPKHRGKWSGCSLDELTDTGWVRHPPQCECQHEDNITGWLPNVDSKVSQGRTQ
jgi:hypothetical protein